MRHCANPECDQLKRYGFAAEFRDEIRSCSECGEALAAGPVPEPVPVDYGFAELRTVYKAANTIQAHLIKGVMEQEGIPVHIRGEDLSGAVGELPANVVEVALEVPPEFAERAREIAVSFEENTRTEETDAV